MTSATKAQRAPPPRSSNLKLRERKHLRVLRTRMRRQMLDNAPQSVRDAIAVDVDAEVDVAGVAMRPAQAMNFHRKAAMRVHRTQARINIRTARQGSTTHMASLIMPARVQMRGQASPTRLTCKHRARKRTVRKLNATRLANRLNLLHASQVSSSTQERHSPRRPDRRQARPTLFGLLAPRARAAHGDLVHHVETSEVKRLGAEQYRPYRFAAPISRESVSSKPSLASSSRSSTSSKPLSPP